MVHFIQGDITVTDTQADILITHMARWFIPPTAGPEEKAAGRSTIACIVADTCNEWKVFSETYQEDCEALTKAYVRWSRLHRLTS